jgi:hypothetical protein
MYYPQRFLVLTISLLLLTGCAQFPPGVNSSSSGGMLNITMTVSGQINPNYFYFVVFNNINDPHGVDGPEPVIAPPWGNGFVAGAATTYVAYTPTQPGDGYLIYNFTGSTLQQSAAVGAPIQDTPVQSGGNTIQFQIPIADLATSTVSASATNYIQVNFIATNRIPVNPDDTSPKEFDALGDSHPGTGQLNDYITIPTNQSNSFSDTSTQDEPTGDEEVTNGSGGYSSVNDPDVDISGWSIQVTN